MPSSGTSVRGSISVAMVCRNEADKMPAALASVGWADEVVVLDLSSQDGSATVARDAGAVVHGRAPHPIVEPLRDEVAGHCSGAWVLVLDPDERITPGLATALRAAALRDDVDAVVMPRMNIDFGWSSSSPLQRYEPQLRMYRRSAVSWPHFPNALPKVPEDRVLRLPLDDAHVMEHERNRDVAETADRLVRYAPAEARALLERGEVFTAAGMWAVLAKQFNRQVIQARAWEDGVPGLVRAGVLVNHHFYVWVALWQQSGSPRSAEDDQLARRLGYPLRALGAVQHVRHLVRERTSGRPGRARAGSR